TNTIQYRLSRVRGMPEALDIGHAMGRNKKAYQEALAWK
ncbi:hypothetical protein LCGC14_2812950, partial [marine sediment metagenome]